MSFGAMEVLNLNGVLVWTSITGGKEKCEVPADKLNLEWVLGNKLLLGSVNANREHFEMGIRDLAMAEMNYPGVVQRILTHPVQGLEGYEQMMKLLVDGKKRVEGLCRSRQGMNPTSCGTSKRYRVQRGRRRRNCHAVHGLFRGDCLPRLRASLAGHVRAGSAG